MEKISRLHRCNIFMSVAVLFSKRATCLRGSGALRGGSCLVQNGRIVSVGYTGSPRGTSHCTDVGCDISPITGGCLRTLHSEANCIISAANAGINLSKGGTLYTTISPCLSCAKIIISSNIDVVIYLQQYRDPAGVDYLLKAGKTPMKFDTLTNSDPGFINHIVLLQGGLSVGEC